MVSRSFRSLYNATKDFFGNGGLLASSALAFNALLSFIPLVFLVVLIADRYLGGRTWVEHFVSTKFETLPWIKKLLLERLGTFHRKMRGLGWVSLGFLLWQSGAFFLTLRHSFARIWPPPKGKGFLRHLVVSWLAGPFLTIVLLAFVMGGHLVGYIPFTFFTIHPVVWTLAGQFLIIFVIYRTLLPQKCSLTSCTAVSALLALAIQGVTLLFTSVIWLMPDYRLVYGTLSSTVLFLVWLDYGMALLLFGAHFLRHWNTGPRRG